MILSQRFAQGNEVFGRPRSTIEPDQSSPIERAGLNHIAHGRRAEPECATEFVAHFETSGFVDVRVDRQEQDLVISGGVRHAIEAAYSTPIGPKLLSLADERQVRFKEVLTELVNELSNDGITMGRMASDVLSAQKRE